MTDETLAACRAAQGVLKGPVGDLSMVLSAAMMLDWLGETDAGRRVRTAVDGALRDGAITLHPDGTVEQGTRAAGHAVPERLQR